MALAHLCNGPLPASRPASRCPTVWRYLREAVRLAYAILDGTLIPIDQVADQRPYYSGKHKRDG